MRYKILFAAALLAVACVGHPADDEDDFPGPDGPGGQPVEEAAAPGLVLDFTATWCVNCPRMTSAIEEAMSQRPGAVFPVCVHFKDVFSFPDGEDLANYFNIQEYPSAIINLDKGSLTTATSKDIIISRIDAAVRKKPCDIKLSYADGVLSASVTAAESGSYRLGALLLEDGLVAAQTGGTEDYVHDNILRKILSADIFGEDLGSLESGAVAGSDFPIDNLADSGKYHVVAYVTDGGIVNSATSITLP
ncbi:MAG: Omp28-related outer membrane protein [Bacteroidales bacterium]|nr:Omp28-related outer membrane protein [Bacteroidales bacterium]